MAVPVIRILDPIYGKPILRAANNGRATWTKVNALSQWQKGTGWQACLYGGVQTGDDWGAIFIPVNEQNVIDFKSALWSYYMTQTQTMGVNIVIWVHDPNDFKKRAEITQLQNIAGLGKAAGWNSHALDKTVAQFYFYGENTTGTALRAGPPNYYSWADFQADALFRTWTIYRISLEYGWEASGTFDNVWVTELKLNGTQIPIMPPEAQLLEDLKTLIVLAAGANIIGKVGIDQTTPGTTNAVVEASAADIKTAVQVIDNFISGSRGLVTEDNSASIKTAVELIDNMISEGKALTVRVGNGLLSSGIKTDVAAIKDSAGAVYWLTVSDTAALAIALNDSDDGEGEDLWGFDLPAGGYAHFIFDPPLEFAVGIYLDVSTQTCKVTVGYI